VNYYERRQIEASAKLAAMLDLPPIPQGGEMYSDGECFDPWKMFPCLYGSYSSAFDAMAIEVLINIRDGKFEDDDLASEMFREMLCTVGLCDYGTSPRVCFASTQFAPLLPRLIERWQEYAAIKWQD
jgi:hypothetical protein